MVQIVSFYVILEFSLSRHQMTSTIASFNHGLLFNKTCLMCINCLKKYIFFLWTRRYIVSDCDSVGVYYDQQHYTSSPEEAAADAIKAGFKHL